MATLAVTGFNGVYSMKVTIEVDNHLFVKRVFMTAHDLDCQILAQDSYKKEVIFEHPISKREYKVNYSRLIASHI